MGFSILGFSIWFGNDPEPYGFVSGNLNPYRRVDQCVPSWLTVQAECTVGHCYGPLLLLGLGFQAQAMAIEDLRSLDKPTFYNDFAKMILDHFRNALKPDGIYSLTLPVPRDNSIK